MASAVLVTDSAELAEAVRAEVEAQLAVLPRQGIAAEAIAQYGAIIVVDTIDEGVALVNRLAPEHLEIVTADPMDQLAGIENAGAIFLGPYSSEPVGDYFAGPNHIIPTNGTARFSSPVDVDMFMKKSSLIRYSKEALLKNGDMIMTLARHEEWHICQRMKQQDVHVKHRLHARRTKPISLWRSLLMEQESVRLIPVSLS